MSEEIFIANPGNLLERLVRDTYSLASLDDTGLEEMTSKRQLSQVSKTMEIDIENIPKEDIFTRSVEINSEKNSNSKNYKQQKLVASHQDRINKMIINSLENIIHKNVKTNVNPLNPYLRFDKTSIAFEEIDDKKIRYSIMGRENTEFEGKIYSVHVSYDNDPVKIPETATPLITHVKKYSPSLTRNFNPHEIALIKHFLERDDTIYAGDTNNLKQTSYAEIIKVIEEQRNTESTEEIIKEVKKGLSTNLRMEFFYDPTITTKKLNDNTKLVVGELSNGVLTLPKDKVFSQDCDGNYIQPTFNFTNGSPGGTIYDLEKSARVESVDELEPGKEARLGNYGGGGTTYKIIKKLGEGGQGVVFLVSVNRGIGPNDELKYVMKLMHSNDSTHLNALIKEGKIALNIQSDSIVKCVDIGFLEGEKINGTKIPAIVTEYMDGGSLEDQMEDTFKIDIEHPQNSLYRFGNKLVSFYTGLTFQGIQELHHNFNLIHRDIAPDNILFQKTDGSLKIGDLGITVRKKDIDEIQKTGLVSGKIPFMNYKKELIDRYLNEQTDIYAASTIIYTLLTGGFNPNLAYNDDKLSCDNFQHNPTVYKSSQDPNNIILSPSRIVKDVPHELDFLIMRGLGVQSYVNGNGERINIEKPFENAKEAELTFKEFTYSGGGFGLDQPHARGVVEKILTEDRVSKIPIYAISDEYARDSQTSEHIDNLIPEARIPLELTDEAKRYIDARKNPARPNWNIDWDAVNY